MNIHLERTERLVKAPEQEQHEEKSGECIDGVVGWEDKDWLSVWDELVGVDSNAILQHDGDGEGDHVEDTDHGLVDRLIGHEDAERHRIQLGIEEERVRSKEEDVEQGQEPKEK